MCACVCVCVNDDRSCPGAGTVDPLLAKIDVLEKENMFLASQLDKRKLKGAGAAEGIRHVHDMSESIAVLPVT